MARKAITEAEFSEVERLRHAFTLRAHSILRNWADAEDEVQDAFCQAWRYRGDCAGELSNWMWRIVINESLMRLRELREHPCDPAILARLVVDRRTPESQYVADERRRIALHALECMPEAYRTAIKALYLGEKTAPPGARYRALRGCRELRRRIHSR